MPEPAELLHVARLLWEAGKSQDPVMGYAVDALMRRAVSTAYYAVFNKITRSAALKYTGSDGENAVSFAIIARGLQHREIRSVCDAVAKHIMPERYQRYLRRRSVSQAARDFAQTFADLQVAREKADYDSDEVFYISRVETLIDEALEALESFDRIPQEEQSGILALMLVGARG